MELAKALKLELKSYCRVEKVLDRMLKTLEWPEGTDEFRELKEVLAMKEKRIASLKARLTLDQTRNPI